MWEVGRVEPGGCVAVLDVRLGPGWRCRRNGGSAFVLPRTVLSRLTDESEATIGAPEAAHPEDRPLCSVRKRGSEQRAEHDVRLDDRHGGLAAGESVLGSGHGFGLACEEHVPTVARRARTLRVDSPDDARRVELVETSVATDQLRPVLESGGVDETVRWIGDRRADRPGSHCDVSCHRE